MASSRRSATAVVALVAYLAGLVGGALHHHHAPYASHAATQTHGQRADHPSLWATDGGDDADGCAVCAAIHQAKAPPLAPAALTHSTPTADVVTATPTKPPLPYRATSRARGPPLI